MGCGGSKSDGAQPNGGRAGNKGGGRGGAGNQGSNTANTNKTPVNEKGYKKRIRENLRQASAGNDIDELERMMTIFNNNHMEDGGDYSEAERRLDFLLTRKEIRDACMRDHPEILDKAIQKVEASPYKKQLKPYLERAYYLKKHQNELERYRHDISDLDQSTISEIRSYHHPPPPVHTTMIATYMVLGYPEHHLCDWTVITALMGRYGKDSLVREVQQVDTSKIDNTVGLKARNYLCQYTQDEVRSVSAGAAAFYVWTSKVVGKYESKGNKSADTQPKPLRNTGGKASQPGSQPVTPASQTKPANDKKQTKPPDNKTKQQQDNKAKQQDNKTKQQDNKTKQHDNKTKQQQDSKTKQQQDNKTKQIQDNKTKQQQDAKTKQDDKTKDAKQNAKTVGQNTNTTTGKTTKKG